MRDLLCEATTLQVDVAYLHMCGGLECEPGFSALLRFIAQNQTVWSINLGELEFTVLQLDELLLCIADSNITHMFIECDSLPLGYKPQFLSALRRNRLKHKRWVIDQVGPEQAVSIRECQHMWYNPMRHGVNCDESTPRTASSPSLALSGDARREL